MSADDPDWPAAPFDNAEQADRWLRFERQYPGSGRNSRLVAHWTAPYVADYTDKPDSDTLALAAGRYLCKLVNFMHDTGRPLDLPNGWAEALVPARCLHDDNSDETDDDTQDDNILQWLPVWPTFGTVAPASPPRLASWNLSRDADHDLPATVIMVAAETMGEGPFSPNVGLRVPMRVLPLANGGFRVIIRSLTAELPRPGTVSATEVLHTGIRADRIERLRNIVPFARSDEGRDVIAASAPVEPGTLRTEELHFAETARFDDAPIILAKSKARGRSRSPVTSDPRKTPPPPSLCVESRLDFSGGAHFEATHLRHSPLVSHAVGEARVFVRTPADSPFVKTPGSRYRFSRRRPALPDKVLDEYRVSRRLSGHVNKMLTDTGFRVRECPGFVHTDNDRTATKEVQLPGNDDPQPRRDDFSAISAFVNARDFFDLMGAFGLPPSTYVVSARQELQIFYRHGITPGPGGSGNTVNAQVAYHCTDANLPYIDMNLALADLSRWARPPITSGDPQWAQPLGIASSGRWMLHEAGHYLLAARIGQLEFDFAHSAGDALAAVVFDPSSRLADPRDGVAAAMRGYTYPFVFAPRRHDRTPLLGWGWYGYLNRPVIENVPCCCDVTKGYLSEQILSSTVFRLYRSLGGDTVKGNGSPDHDLRRRAAAMTLFLLIRAIAGLAQSPSRAEMLELGMEDVSLTMTLPLPWPLPGGAGKYPPQLDVHIPDPPPRTPAPPPPPWQGGVAHKVVRWAFEAQGMFPPDETATQHGPGLAPPVDLYIRDRRPESEPTEAGPVEYDPGSYRPVSLHWGNGMDWTMAEPFEIGNRGRFDADGITGRVWVGVVDGSPTAPHWADTNEIDWSDFGSFPVPGPVSPGPAQGVPGDPLSVARAEFESLPGVVLLLVEISCPYDRANTDPDADLVCAVTGTDGLPVTPRALADLVAGDNNLGLLVRGI